VSDAQDFDEFYARSQSGVLRQIIALTGDVGEAQDIVQEAYLRAWQRWQRIQAYEQPEAWVRTVACHLAVSRWRRVRRLAGVLARTGPPAITAGPGPDHVALVDALKHLPAPQRIAVVLHYVGDLPLDEIAAQMNCSLGTVKSRLSRARASLAEILSGPATSDMEGASDERTRQRA
jgi:RNA polymerase sigma-70 factor (ECF subfamily)